MLLVLYFSQQIPSPAFCKVRLNYNKTSLQLLIIFKLSPPDFSQVWLLLFFFLCFSCVLSTLMPLEGVKNEIWGEPMEAAEQQWVPAARGRWGLSSFLCLCPQTVTAAQAEVETFHTLRLEKHQKLSVWKAGACTCRLSRKFLVGWNLFFQLTMNSSKNFLSQFFFRKYRGFFRKYRVLQGFFLPWGNLKFV